MSEFLKYQCLNIIIYLSVIKKAMEKSQKYFPEQLSVFL